MSADGRKAVKSEPPVSTNPAALDVVMLTPPRTPLRLLDRFVNPIVRLVLRSRVQGLLSRSVLLLTVMRENGRERTIPVRYAQDDGVLVILVGLPEQKRWWRQLRKGAPVEVRLRGSMQLGSAVALVGGGYDAEQALALYLRRYPNTPLPRGVGSGGVAPSGAALARAAEWAVMVRITLANS